MLFRFFAKIIYCKSKHHCYQVIETGLNNYEKSNPAAPSTLFGPLMILKAVCINNASYVDQFITIFMKVLHKLAKEHLQPSGPSKSNLPSTFSSDSSQCLALFQ